MLRLALLMLVVPMASAVDVRMAQLPACPVTRGDWAYVRRWVELPPCPVIWEDGAGFIPHDCVVSMCEANDESSSMWVMAILIPVAIFTFLATRCYYQKLLHRHAPGMEQRVCWRIAAPCDPRHTRAIVHRPCH